MPKEKASNSKRTMYHKYIDNERKILKEIAKIDREFDDEQPDLASDRFHNFEYYTHGKSELENEKITEILQKQEMGFNEYQNKLKPVLNELFELHLKNQKVKNNAIGKDILPIKSPRPADAYVTLTMADSFEHGSTTIGERCLERFDINRSSIGNDTGVLCDNWFNFSWHMKHDSWVFNTCENGYIFDFIFEHQYTRRGGWVKPLACIQLVGNGQTLPGILTPGPLGIQAHLFRTSIELKAKLIFAQEINGEILTWENENTVLLFGESFPTFIWDRRRCRWVPNCNENWIQFTMGPSVMPIVREGHPIQCHVQLEAREIASRFGQCWMDFVVTVPYVQMEIFYT